MPPLEVVDVEGCLEIGDEGFRQLPQLRVEELRVIPARVSQLFQLQAVQHFRKTGFLSLENNIITFRNGCVKMLTPRTGC